MKNYDTYLQAQDMARYAMDELVSIIRPGMSEREIKKQAEILLIKAGSDSFWYHGVGALVHVGERTLISQGGREYRASEQMKVAQTDVVTLDLAPTCDTAWGDYARTIFVENGKAILKEELLTEEAHKAAITCELEMHRFLMETATPTMTFEELHRAACEKLEALGCVNLDYSSNFGHSVVVLQQDRVYIEPGNRMLLGDVHSFTFEPHIQLGDQPFGVKRENIYFFRDGEISCL